MISEVWLIFLVFVCFILSGVVAYLFFQVKSLSHSSTPKQNSSEVFCANHPDIQAAGVCNICEQGFCSECIKEEDGLSLCPEHLRLYLTNEWESLETVRTTPEEPHEALHLYSVKKELWQEKSLPLVVRTHYQINLEADFIESYVQLQSIKSQADEVKELLKVKGKAHA